MPITLVVNDQTHQTDVPSFYPLAIVLREELGLTGTKIGCFEGRCGACTVLLDDRPLLSCIFPVGAVGAGRLRTVEGLAGADGSLSPLQAAVLDGGGVQCGACTPGVLMSLTALLEGDPAPDEDAIREALEGNLCRCTGYQQIIEAVTGLGAGASR